MLIIFYEDFTKVKNIIAKLKQESASPVQEINILDFLNSPENFKISSDNVAYFLFNSTLSALLFDKLDSSRCTILNKDFFLLNLDKKKVQELLLNNNINVPKIIDFNKTTNQKLILKSKNHTLPVHIFESHKELDNFLINYNANDYYAEEFIDSDTEYKIYYVNGKMFFYDNTKPICDKQLNNSFNQISKMLKLDIFSADILFKDNKFFIIDINPAAGLFMSKSARQELLNFVK